MLNKADIVDRKYECNEKGRGLTQKEQRMQGEKLITIPSPIRVKCRNPIFGQKCKNKEICNTAFINSLAALLDLQIVHRSQLCHLKSTLWRVLYLFRNLHGH